MDPHDLISNHSTPKSQIQTVNGVSINVAQLGTVDISSSMQLKNCLLIPSLTNILLSVSQLTKK